MTEVVSLPWPRDLLTVEDWEALPEDGSLRRELVEGVLVMTPPPYSFHQNATTELTYVVKRRLPQKLTALANVEVILGEDPPTIRIPDVVVTSTAVYRRNPPRYRASDVKLAVEVLSRGTRRVDRVLKFSEYADAGIPQYWIVDLESPITLTAYVLVDGDYEVAGVVTGTVDLEVDGHPVRIDLDSLIER